MDEKADTDTDDDAPKFLGVQHGDRNTRGTVRPIIVEVEDLEKGEIRCPHPDCMRNKIGVLVADHGYKKVTSTNHKPHFFYFCIHCKTENAECDCVDSCAVVFRLSQRKKRAKQQVQSETKKKRRMK